MGYVGSRTSTRDKANSQYISGCNPHLTSRFCEVELDLKSTSNNIYMELYHRVEMIATIS